MRVAALPGVRQAINVTQPNSKLLLEHLWEGDLIALRRGRIFDRMPAHVDLEQVRTHKRVEGMLLGLAVGDALGHSTEWQYDPERRRREFGVILDYVASGHSRPGAVSDADANGHGSASALPDEQPRN